MEIRPFKGWRYGEREVSSLIAPPYDILSAQDKQALIAGNGRNVVVVDMPHVPPTGAGPDELYAQAAKTVAQWKASGTLAQDAPAVYAYQQEFRWAGKDYRRRAMLCGIRATEFGKDVIPHEHTFAGPKADRLKLTQQTRMQLSPIFGFYNDPKGKASDLLWSAARGEPDAHGVMRGVTEKLWVIRDEKVISQIAAVLRPVPVFIADGHHRYTTTMNYRDQLLADGKIDANHEANFVLFALVAKDDPALLILPTHRVIRGLAADFSLAKLMAAATDFTWQGSPVGSFDLTDASASLAKFGPHAMAFLERGSSQVWIAKPKSLAAMDKLAADQAPAWRQLDVAILHKLIVDRDLAVWKTADTAIEYTPDGKIAFDACNSGKAQLGVCLQGTPIDAVEAIALAGASMPHKSTYFYPKLATGMVLKPLE